MTIFFAKKLLYFQHNFSVKTLEFNLCHPVAFSGPAKFLEKILWVNAPQDPGVILFPTLIQIPQNPVHRILFIINFYV